MGVSGYLTYSYCDLNHNNYSCAESVHNGSPSSVVVQVLLNE